MIFEFNFKNNFYKFSKDGSGQGAAELILILGGVLVVVLILVHIYKSYVSDFGNDMNFNEVNKLNNSFTNLSSKFD